ncbi:MAG: hypothetical protein U0804_21555 [Gemmataceae bacterium]
MERASDGWTTTGSVGGLQAAVTTFLRGRGMRVTGEQSGEVHARREAGWFSPVFGRLAPQRWLPYRAVIKLQHREAGVGVRAEVEAVAPPDGRRAADYRTLFARWMAELRRVLPDASPGVSAVPPG